MAKALLVHPDDSVATLVEPASEGDAVTYDGHEVIALVAIPSGHKVAIAPIADRAFAEQSQWLRERLGLA